MRGLALSGPWQKPAEAIDYVRALKPARAFSVHDEILSEVGKTVVNGLLGENGPGTGAGEVVLTMPQKENARGERAFSVVNLG